MKKLLDLSIIKIQSKDGELNIGYSKSGNDYIITVETMGCSSNVRLNKDQVSDLVEALKGTLAVESHLPRPPS